MIRIAKPTEEAFLALDYYGREEDRIEAHASHNMSLYEASKLSSERSTEAYAIYKTDGVDEKLLCLTGVAPHSLVSDVASPWLLTTRFMKEHPRDLLKYTKFFIDMWKKEWLILENYVDARYDKAVRWAKWAGFDIHPAKPFGVEGEMFHRIVIGE